MRKERTLLFLGIWVAILPFLGFPNSWRTFLFFITGCALVFLAYLFYKANRARRSPHDESLAHPFVDSVVSNDTNNIS